MSSRPDLQLDWCSHKAARFAVERWHYSDSMPLGKLVKVGVWEDEAFTGAIIFARGNNHALGSPYGLDQTEVCELVRIALRQHAWPVTRMVRIALSMLKESNPGLRLVVSFADPAQDHHGGIYQGGNWIFAGSSNPVREFWYQGRWQHQREITAGAFGSEAKVKDYSDLPSRRRPGKFRYLMPLDDEMREQIEPLAKPYPKPEDLPAPEA